MAIKNFCDDCDKEITRENLVRIWTYHNHPFPDTEMCLDCFKKHWKPITDKFAIKAK